MEKLVKKYNDLQDALTSLHNVLQYYDNLIKKTDFSNNEQHIHADIVRDSVIQRFEYCVELTWKYLALYMQIAQGISISVISPKAVMRTACRAGIITEQQSEAALVMIEDRNQTSHMYKEEIADVLAKAIPKHYQLMAVIIAACKKDF